MDYRNQKTISPNLPFEAYTEVRSGVDPGRDNVTGTSDDGTVNVWAVPRNRPFFADPIRHRIQALENEGNDHYHGYEFTFNKQNSDGWSMMVTAGTNLRKTRHNNPTNPNQMAYRNANQKNVWSKMIKLNGIYELPFGFQYSTALLGQSENWYTGKFGSGMRTGGSSQSSRRGRSAGSRS